MNTRNKWTIFLTGIAIVVVAGLLLFSLGGLDFLASQAQEATPTPAAEEEAPPLQAGVEQALPAASLPDLYEQLIPSVVKIEVTIEGASQIGPFGLPPGPQGGEGSGWVFDTQGHIVTNNHVVENADRVTVIFHNGFWAEAEVVATDPQADLAVLNVTPPEGVSLQPLPLAEPGRMRVGDAVVAIGNPFGLEGTMTLGIVSAVGRSVPTGATAQTRYSLPDVIQTDAAINPGNSGGPLLNLAGQVVGVNFAIRSATGANAGVGFAIPNVIIQRIVPALIEDGEFLYPYLGISGGSVGPQLAEQEEIAANTLGAFVSSIVEGGPAAGTGLQEGDIIIAIDDQSVRTFNDLVSHLVLEASPGDEVTLGVLRDEEQVEIQVTLGERPAAAAPPTAQQAPGRVPAQAALAIALEMVDQQDLLEGPIENVNVAPDTSDGQPIWVVELGDAQNTATVTIDALSGEVLDVSVEE